jgi:hypothetical protein
MSSFQNKHILIIVENLPVPFDTRVWNIANTLKDNDLMLVISVRK